MPKKVHQESRRRDACCATEGVINSSEGNTAMRKALRGKKEGGATTLKGGCTTFRGRAHKGRTLAGKGPSPREGIGGRKRGGVPQEPFQNGDAIQTTPQWWGGACLTWGMTHRTPKINASKRG